MVVIHVKKSDSESFLYETTCATTNDALIRELVEVWNMRLRLAQLSGYDAPLVLVPTLAFPLTPPLLRILLDRSGRWVSMES